MIIQKCDICLKEVKQLNTIVMYKQPIEYCDKCKEKVEEFVREFSREINFEREVMNASLRSKERDYIKELKGVQKNDKRRSKKL